MWNSQEIILLIVKQSGYRRNHIRDIKKMESIESDLQITKVKNEKELL